MASSNGMDVWFVFVCSAGWHGRNGFLLIHYFVLVHEREIVYSHRRKLMLHLDTVLTFYYDQLHLHQSSSFMFFSLNCPCGFPISPQCMHTHTSAQLPLQHNPSPDHSQVETKLLEKIKCSSQVLW